MSEEAAQATNLVDADPLRVALGLVVPRPPDQEEIGMSKASDLAEDGMIGADRSLRPALLKVCEHCTGKKIGKRRLADAFRSDDQPSVMQPAACQRCGELSESRVMAEQTI